MDQGLSDSLLARLSEFVAARTALHFPRERWGDLKRKAGSAAKGFGFGDEASFIKWLTVSPLTTDQIEFLVSHLTISETYFWREPQVFEALERKVLPELINIHKSRERRLKIWSAGCATGEEPYSIAIALRRAVPFLKDWSITILGTDINPRLLRRAKAGRYGQWSFRNAPPWLQKDHFRPASDGRFEILPEIRDMVTFAYLNLAEDIYPSPLNFTNAMDVIFCRNVLMYFSPERARQVGQSLYLSLVDGGWLVVGACELSSQTFPQFTSVHFPGAVAYQKQSRTSRAARAFRFEENLSETTSACPPWEAPVEAGPPAPAPPGRQAETTTLLEPPASPRNARAAALDFPEPDSSPEPAGRPQGREEPGAVAPSVRALANQGRLAEALAWCEKAIAADKLDPGLHYLRAVILQEKNLAAEAVASLRRALYLDPDLLMAHFSLGNLMLRQGDGRAAKRCFANVLGLLNACRPEEVLPQAEGLTAGRFREIVRATIRAGDLA